MPPSVTAAVRARASRIKLVLMDIDGVLTDGKYFHVPNPQGGLFEVKLFDSQDGIALQWLHRLGIKTGQGYYAYPYRNAHIVPQEVQQPEGPHERKGHGKQHDARLDDRFCIQEYQHAYDQER